jgi:hypothetical protein
MLEPLLSKLKLLKILLLALSFSFSQSLGLCGFFFTLLPVIKLIKDHWQDQDIISVIINETKDVSQGIVKKKRTKPTKEF